MRTRGWRRIGTAIDALAGRGPGRPVAVALIGLLAPFPATKLLHRCPPVSAGLGPGTKVGYAAERHSSTARLNP